MGYLAHAQGALAIIKHFDFPTFGQILDRFWPGFRVQHGLGLHTARQTPVRMRCTHWDE